MNQEYDVIVVGTGIGGSTVAREMSRKGKRVLMLERGGYMKLLGNTLSMALVLQHFGLVMSREKYVVTFAHNYGGLSTLAAGCAVPPPEKVFGPHGIDLKKEAEEAREDMHIQILPDALIGATNLHLLDAAQDAGYNWTRMENFIDPGKCVEGCSLCMLGCPHGAKFSARDFGDEAIRNGAELELHTNITDVITENGRAVGVKGRKLGKKVRYYGKTIVLSSGISNVDILRRAGIAQAGRGFACDWLQFAGAEIPGMNTVRSNPMTVGSLEHYDSDGIAILPVFPNWSQFMVMLGMMGITHLKYFPRFWRYSGIMVKIRDEISGEIYHGTSFSKPVTTQDEKKLSKGIEIIKKVFRKAGANTDEILVLKPSGAHPSASCRIGEVVDADLQTEIKNLFCCDASVFPEALGLPVIWTLVSLGKRLSRHLDTRLNCSI